MMVRKGRILAAAAFVTLVLFVAAIILLNRPEVPPAEVVPEITDIGPSRVTIAWRTDRIESGRVFYRTVGSEGPPRSADDPLGSLYAHEVVIEGLEPGKAYTYRLDGSKARYQFRLPPPATMPFSFLVTWGDVSSQIASLLAHENPDFILSLTPRFSKDRDLFADAKSSVRIFQLNVSPIRGLGSGKERMDGKEWTTWTLDWGGLRLVMYDGQTGMPESLETATAHTVGVVCRSDVFPSGGTDERSATAAVRSSSLHQTLLAYNQEFPSHPAAFVLGVKSNLPATEVDRIGYAGVPTDQDPLSGAFRIDVAMGSATGVFLHEGREVSLRRGDLRQKRTCEECRQLADQGAYEESVKAYQEFIEAHQDHFQIDDAYFAIAEILDENLFRYAQAIEWYEDLLESYPGSSLAPLARERLSYLTEHSDYDFEPLARFERIRKVEFARKLDRAEELESVLGEVRAIITEFPECRLAPDMTYWLANRIRRTDPDRAVAIYREFIERYPDNPMVDSVRLEIGETYYNARRYRDAIRVYEEAILAVPSQADAAEAQIARAERNLRRRSLAWAGWIVLFSLAGFGIFWPPAGISVRKFAAASGAWVILAFVIALAGWLIREQFPSSQQILALALAFAASASLGYPFSSTLAEKMFRVIPGEGRDRMRMMSDTFGAVLGVLFFVAGVYVTVYHVNEHYLILVGL